jgi:hypothetical protein
MNHINKTVNGHEQIFKPLPEISSHLLQTLFDSQMYQKRSYLIRLFNAPSHCTSFISIPSISTHDTEILLLMDESLK